MFIASKEQKGVVVNNNKMEVERSAGHGGREMREKESDHSTNTFNEDRWGSWCSTPFNFLVESRLHNLRR